MVDCQRRGNDVAVLSRLELAAVEIVVARESEKVYDAHAAKKAGWTAARAERTKQTCTRISFP